MEFQGSIQFKAQKSQSLPNTHHILNLGAAALEAQAAQGFINHRSPTTPNSSARYTRSGQRHHPQKKMQALPPSRQPRTAHLGHRKGKKQKNAPRTLPSCSNSTRSLENQAPNGAGKGEEVSVVIGARGWEGCWIMASFKLLF